MMKRQKKFIKMQLTKNNNKMKKTITIILLIISIVAFAQKNESKEKQRIDSLEQKINALNYSIEKLKQDDASLYVLKDKIINDKINYQKTEKKISDLDNKVDERLDNWIVKHIEAFMAFIGAILAIIFWIVGKKINAEKIQKEVEEKIAKLTNIEEEFIHKNLTEYKKHIDIKNNAKIIVLNEKGTDFPDGFKKVLQLYKNYTEHNHRIDITGLKEALQPTMINKLKEADVVIIENQVEKDNKGKEKHWKIDIKYCCKSIDDIKRNSIIGTAEDRKPFENNLHLIELCNKICDTTAVIYYGQAGKGNFPSNFVDSDKQHMITFANAPSQLYGNILNMLKFKFELENA